MGALVYATPSVEELYDRYADMLFRLAYSALFSKEDAEDAIQEVFSKYLKKMPYFSESEHEKAWFIRVTVNQCRDIRRRRAIRGYTPLEEMTESPTYENDSAAILEQVFALPDKYKTAIILHYFEEYSVADIASALKITKSAVKMRLSRGRDLLKTEIDKGGDGYV